MHLSEKTVDDEVSEEAYKLYLERIDYGKQFLLRSDVKELREYHDQFDDQLVSGQLEIVKKTSEIMDKRLKEVEGIIKEVLKRPFNYDKSEQLESDGEKREFVKNSAELKDRWRKLLKYESLSRLVDLREEKETAIKAKKEKKDDKKEKTTKKNKKKKKKSLADNKDLTKMNDKELEAFAREKIRKSYLRIISRMQEEKLEDKEVKYYNAITRVFDPHTNYLAPDEKEDFDIDISGKLEGIGAILKEDGPYIQVDRIVPGSASWKTKKLEAGDTILKVAQGDKEPVDIVDLGLREAVKLIRGPKGTEVRLTVKKPNGLIQVIPIIRDIVEIAESYAKSTVLEVKGNKNKIGYIALPKFYRDFTDSKKRNCTDDVRKALEAFNKRKVTGVILDLRNNSGGALEDARMMSGLFIKKGPIVQVKTSSSPAEVLSDTNKKVSFDKPLIVLINKFSASASEIVAAALQDYKRAVVVGGEFSHGKGTVQLIIDLDNYLAPMAKSFAPLGSLKITIQKFYRINGDSTQYKGVTPDIILPDPYGHLDSGEQSLKHSIPWGEVKPLSYEVWDKQKYDLKKLTKASQRRVAKNPRFKVIKSNIEWYKKRKKFSKRSLNMKDYLKERDEVKKRTDELDKLKEYEALVITKMDKDKGNLDKERFEEFSKSLRTDPTIEESLNIIFDMM